MAFTKEFLAKLGIAIDKEEVTDEEGQALISKAMKDKDDEKVKLKGQVDKYSSEIAVLKDEKKAKMTDDEKKDEHVKELEEQIKTANRQIAINNKVSSLVELGYDKETATKYATDELDGKDTIEYQKAFLEKQKAEMKAQILKEQKKPDVDKGDPNKKYTKEGFAKGEYSAEELNALKTTNPDVYKNLISD